MALFPLRRSSYASIRDSAYWGRQVEMTEMSIVRSIENRNRYMERHSPGERWYSVEMRAWETDLRTSRGYLGYYRAQRRRAQEHERGITAPAIASQQALLVTYNSLTETIHVGPVEEGGNNVLV